MTIAIGTGIGFSSKTRKILVRDDFNRADNATSLGNAITGQAWTVGSGTWGISGNKAYTSASVADSSAYAESGLSDVFISSSITFDTGEAIVFRVLDSSNYLYVRINSVNLGLFRMVAGAVTQLGTNYTFTPVAGNVYRVGVLCVGSSMKVFLNGVQRIAASETFNQTETKHGIRHSSSTVGRSDDFIIETI